jgi:photosystem II stability/assembly factor-like uncharacterized protein
MSCLLLFCTAAAHGAQNDAPVEIFLVAVAPDDTMYAWASYDSLLRSPDKGATWIDMGRKTNRGRIEGGLWFAVDPEGALYAGTNQGVFKSTDKGASWLATSLREEYITSLSFVDKVLYASSAEGIFASSDRGATWTKKSSNVEGGVSQIAAGSDGSLYAATANGVLKGTAKGSRWRLTNHFTDSTTEREVRHLVVTDRAVYVSTLWRGVFKTTDGGSTWVPVRNGLPEAATAYLFLRTADGALYAGYLSGAVFKSADNGASWRSVQPLPSMVHTIFETSDGTLFATSRHGMFKSTNKAASWAPVLYVLSPKRR